MKLGFTPRARKDLWEIGDYIARDSRSAAARFVARLEMRCTALVSAPDRYPFAHGHRETGIRRAPYRDYLIFYRVSNGSVQILRVLHAAQDTDTLMAGAQPD